MLFDAIMGGMACLAGGLIGDWVRDERPHLMLYGILFAFGMVAMILLR